MKKQEYFFDAIWYSENLHVLQSLIKPLNEFAAFYASMKLKVPFSKELMLQAIENTSELQESLKNDLLKTLKLMNVPVFFFGKMEEEIDATIAELGVKIQEIQNTFNIARQYTQYSLMQDYTLFEVSKSGTVEFNEVSKSKLKELCTVYIENEVQQKAIDIISEINSKTKELYKILSNRLAGIPDDTKSILSTYTESNDGLIKLNATIVERLN